MSVLSDWFPLFVSIALVALASFTIRLWRNVGRGATSAGSREVDRPHPVGLQKTPWELAALDRLVVGSRGQVNPNLIGTINRLVDSAANAGNGAGNQPLLQRLPLEADIDQVSVAIGQLEQRLELDSHPGIRPD